MARRTSETIAAAATPLGRSAIGLIRLSGPGSFDILAGVFHPHGKRAFPAPFAVFPGFIKHPHNGAMIDQVVVTTYVAPHSYTGEDLAEIGTHGNPVVLSSVLATLFAAGAAPAEAGEFTRRAFLNGKMDLLDVEATAQILAATTQAQATIALHQLDGIPAKKISLCRERLLAALTHIEAGINFPEDAIEELDENNLRKEVRLILDDLRRFHDAVKQGQIVAAGLSLALIGRPNTGKSSLLNAILGRERAIVTEIPGTTRDTLEETWNIGGFPVKLIDTAGLREPVDLIEAKGIDRTRQAMDRAFMFVMVVDSSHVLTSEDKDMLISARQSGKPFIVALNKSDLSPRWGVCPPKAMDGVSLGGLSPQFPRMGVSAMDDERFWGKGNFAGIACQISALTGDGIGELMAIIEKVIRSTGLPALDDLVFLGAQQTDALSKAIVSLGKFQDGLGVTYHDLLSVELSDTIRFLGMITGETIDTDTLDRIFERFCIGK